MRILSWLCDALVDLFHLVFAPWPDGEPDPSDLPRWPRVVFALVFIALLAGGVAWFS